MIVKAGSTNVTSYFILRTASDGTATTGATITDVDLQYCRSGAAPSAKVDATALAATDSAHADNKAIEIDGTDAPGLYRVDWPDAAFAANVREVILSVKLASSFTEHLRVELSPAVDVQAVDGDETAAANLNSACDNYSVTRGLTGTALPAAVCDAAGGLPPSLGGAIDLDSKLAETDEVTAARMGALTDWIDGGRLDLLLDALPTTAEVNAEVDTALSDINLDHLCKTATGGADMTSEVADNSILSRVLANGDTSAFVPSTDGLQPIRDRGDAAWIAATTVTTVTGNVDGNVGGNVTGSVGSLSATAKGHVNAEVVDVLETDTHAEPGQGAPAATASLKDKIGYLYKNWRNKKKQDATSWELFADNTTTVDQASVISDDGTDAIKGEIGTGA